MTTKKNSLMPKQNISTDWIDSDEPPHLGAAWFDSATAYIGDKPVSRVRQKAAERKQLVSLRLDRDVVDRFRETGPGWQTRINDQLRKVAGL